MEKGIVSCDSIWQGKQQKQNVFNKQAPADSILEFLVKVTHSQIQKLYFQILSKHILMGYNTLSPYQSTVKIIPTQN